jgi:hypothetical protein
LLVTGFCFPFFNGKWYNEEKEAEMLMTIIQMFLLGLLFDVSFNLRRMNKKLDEVVNKKS